MKLGKVALEGKQRFWTPKGSKLFQEENRVLLFVPDFEDDEADEVLEVDDDLFRTFDLFWTLELLKLVLPEGSKLAAFGLEFDW